MTVPAADALVPVGSPEYFVLLGLLVVGRGMDLLSTWVATPTLALEANPVARALGWRWGILVNLGVVTGLAILPLAAVTVITMSLLVAARNLQSAWLMRTLGEYAYRAWIAERYHESRRSVFLLCLVLNASCFVLVGGGLMIFGRGELASLGVGFGIVTYAVAVALFTGLSMRRAARLEAEERRELAAWSRRSGSS